MLRWAPSLVLCTCLLGDVPQGYGQATTPPPHLPAETEALPAAVRSGKLEEVKRLVAAGADVNAHDPLGNTALFYAAWPGNAVLLTFLLAHGADVNATQAGSPALECAVLGGRTEAVKLLLGAGARSDLRDVEGHTLLHTAARYGYASIAELLLMAHAEVSAVDGTGHTALDDAVLFAQAGVVPILLRYGADARRLHPQDGRGPLHEACIKGSAALVEMLVAAGADPAGRDKSGQTPLDLALAYKNRGAISALEHLALERPDCRSTVEDAMQSAALRGRTELGRLLIDGGFDINRRTPGGSTYLHLAASKGQKRMVGLFLERGAVVDATDETGGTALHEAALAGSTEIITLLLDHGARIDVADRESGATPLMLAASVSRTEAVALLLARGADPALRDWVGHTALDRARETDNSQTVKLLEAAHGRLRSGVKSAAQMTRMNSRVLIRPLS